MAVPLLLGTYNYYRHFKDFSGSIEDFTAHMRSERDDWEEGQDRASRCRSRKPGARTCDPSSWDRITSGRRCLGC